MTDHLPHLCWSCQQPFGDDRVWLDRHTVIPVCRECWGQIPSAARVDLAMRLMDRGQDGRAISDALGLLQQALRQATDRPLDWLRGPAGDN